MAQLFKRINGWNRVSVHYAGDVTAGYGLPS